MLSTELEESETCESSESDSGLSMGAVVGTPLVPCLPLRGQSIGSESSEEGSLLLE